MAPATRPAPTRSRRSPTLSAPVWRRALAHRAPRPRAKSSTATRPTSKARSDLRPEHPLDGGVSPVFACSAIMDVPGLRLSVSFVALWSAAAVLRIAIIDPAHQARSQERSDLQDVLTSPGPEVL